jgi:hypothetical protein
MVTSTYLDSNFIEPFESYVEQLGKSDKRVESAVYARVGHWGLILAGTVTAFGETLLVGGWTGVLAIVTLGTQVKVNETAQKYLLRGRFILAGFYLHLLKMINPQAVVDVKYNWVWQERLENIAKQAQEFANASDWFQRHVVSRAYYAWMGVVTVVAAIASLFFGAVGGVVSVCTLGLIPKINRLAYADLSMLGGCLFYGYSTILHIINPHSK